MVRKGWLINRIGRWKRTIAVPTGTGIIGGDFESNRIEWNDRRSSDHGNIELARGRKIRFGVTRDEGEAPYYGPLAKEFRCSLEFFLTRGEIASEARCRFEVAQGSPLRPRRRVIAKPFVRERERKRIISSGKLARRILNRWTTAGG